MRHSKEYLCHYGVLGMRWGVHRASRNASKSASAKRKASAYKNTNTELYDHYMDKSEKYSAKSQKLTAKHQSRAGKAYDYTNNESLGKTIGKTLLFGTYGALKYNELRGGGNSRITSAGSAALATLANVYTYQLTSVIEPRISAFNRKGGKNGLGEVVSPKLKSLEDKVKNG